MHNGWDGDSWLSFEGGRGRTRVCDVNEEQRPHNLTVIGRNASTAMALSSGLRSIWVAPGLPDKMGLQGRNMKRTGSVPWKPERFCQRAWRAADGQLVSGTRWGPTTSHGP
ncbi:hypothetical protein TREES_T100002910 [Tupaia chinensis]|uniref:Uncharacterized protein n=1 Tax=Tupaia chinensis TaxID=246437 RepID=L9KTL7_TUPCH|nr:hypothetical protein TREES_T100002910 [Tupaia chinensis]